MRFNLSALLKHENNNGNFSSGIKAGKIFPRHLNFKKKERPIAVALSGNKASLYDIRASYR